jgi:hypothetical protein
MSPANRGQTEDRTARPAVTRHERHTRARWSVSVATDSLTEDRDVTTIESQETPLHLPGRIRSLTGLRAHLQRALELEHALLPPYLCALYSIDAERNLEASQVVSSVVVEEMLHMALVANLLNAVGGRPQLDDPRLLPGYPRRLPLGEGAIELTLAPFGKDALGRFMAIERPTLSSAASIRPTIGRFYGEIERALRELCAFAGEANVFFGDPSRQIVDEHLYDGSGHIVPVDNLATAVSALREIVEQGEGAEHVEVWDGDHDMFHPERDEVGHYYRFQELELGRRFRRGDTPKSGPSGETIAVDWHAVLPMQRNPRSADHPVGSPIRTAQDNFNRAYCTLLQRLSDAFDGRPRALGDAIPIMFNVKKRAQELMQLPTEDGLASAGPSFEYVPREDRNQEGSTDETTRF